MSKIVRLTISSPTENFTHSADEGSTKIGRSLKCEFPIPKEELSREHCVFEYQNGKFFITDLGSKNGVSIDKVRILPNVKTSINEHSSVMLSDIYTLKISDIDLSTKTNFKTKDNDPQLEIGPLELQIQQTPLKRSRQKPIKRSREKTLDSAPKFENLKMIIGFLIILAFIIYQALGR